MLPQHPTKFSKLLLGRNDKRTAVVFNLLSCKIRSNERWLGSRHKYSKRKDTIQEAYRDYLHLRKSRGNLNWWMRRAIGGCAKRMKSRKKSNEES
jgi:hypothetical protein